MPTDADMRAAFLASIIETPGDDTPRLIFADWLEERDAWTEAVVRGFVLDRPDADGLRLLAADWYERAGEGTRAEFIRVQCEGAKAIGKNPKQELEHRAWMLYRDHATESREPWGSPSLHALLKSAGIVLAMDALDWWRRGFVAEVHCPLAAWLEHGPAVARSQPVEVVRITDREPYEDDGFFWAGESATRFPERSRICVPIFEMLPDYSLSDLSRESAFGRLSRACLAWARSQKRGG